MRRAVIVLLIAIAAVIVIGCAGKAEEDPTYNYRVTGAFADWTSSYDFRFIMTNVAKDDPRLKDISGALKDAAYVYMYEYNPAQINPQGWTVDYPGAGVSQDGRYAVKIIRLQRDSFEPSGWGFDMWMPSAEAGGMKNLSPGTMFTPMARSDEDRDAAGDGLGSNNDNPVLLKGNVTYYIVFAVFKDRSRGLGAVVKQ